MTIYQILGLSIAVGGFGLVILVLLWPNARQGRRLLQRWGIGSPSDADIAEAVRYLRRRRFWYPWLFLLMPSLAELTARSANVSSDWGLVGAVILGGLLGELLALRPSRGAHREALLTRRTVSDLVPVWAQVLLAVAITIGLIRCGLGQQWVAFGVIVGTGAIAALIIALAISRPAAGRVMVDLVLRVRSARVATGLAIAVSTALPSTEMSALGALITVVGIAALVAVASPTPQIAAATG